MKFKLLLFLLSFSAFGFAQELKNPNIFAINQSIISADLYTGNAVSISQFDGYIRPKQRKFSVQEGALFDESKNKEINMMAIAQSDHWKQKSGIINMQFPTKQLEQINGQVQVYYNNRENFKYRTNFNLDYYGQGTPDGGIRNEVYKDVSQPLINPYYNSGYRTYQRRRNNRSSNFGFYMTR
ncbi:hypothetical protein [Mesonia aestuariivivens]|uniref:Uncharacterized protein n=1 Tax=Mesonia aestuariivivens TaxID=2796128 RepID=A0ABS6W0N2_9FLAO|nr:hypothetical protein [Mesonia aestuariivivens]MBW2961401.1 hypothetical protein [Mesonia aestuariivivens]